MALSADDRIILIRIKIERAKKHLRDLAAELLVIEKIVTVGPKGNTNPGAAQSIVLAEEFEHHISISVDVVTILGDIVHNLRSALDHLIYQLVWVNTGNEPTSRKIEFPIVETPEGYETAKIRKINGVGEKAREAIDRLRPYKGGNDALWRIHELDIIDKHRALLTVSKELYFFVDWLDGRYRIKTDTPNFPRVFDEQVENDMKLDIDKALSNPQIAMGNSLLPSVHQLVDFVENLVMSFKPYLG